MNIVVLCLCMCSSGINHPLGLGLKQQIKRGGGQIGRQQSSQASRLQQAAANGQQAAGKECARSKFEGESENVNESESDEEENGESRFCRQRLVGS